MNNLRKLPEKKLAVQWFLASLLIISAMWISLNVKWVLGVTQTSYYSAFLISIVLNLIAGLMYTAITKEVAKDL